MKPGRKAHDLTGWGAGRMDKDWNSAVSNVKILCGLYAECPTGAFGLEYLSFLLARYYAGERSEELYEEMMDAE